MDKLDPFAPLQFEQAAKSPYLIKIYCELCHRDVFTGRMKLINELADSPVKFAIVQHAVADQEHKELRRALMETVRKTFK